MKSWFKKLGQELLTDDLSANIRHLEPNQWPRNVKLTWIKNNDPETYESLRLLSNRDLNYYLDHMVF